MTRLDGSCAIKDWLQDQESILASLREWPLRMGPPVTRMWTPRGQVLPVGFTAALSGPRTIRTLHETKAQGIFTAGKGEWANGSVYFPPGTKQPRYDDTSFFEPVTCLALSSELSAQYHSPKLGTLNPGSHLCPHGISNKSLAGSESLQLCSPQPSPSLSPYLKPVQDWVQSSKEKLWLCRVWHGRAFNKHQWNEMCLDTALQTPRWDKDTGQKGPQS